MLDYDSESNTDHAQFRQYSPTERRFLSPDPYGGSYDPANPQSFNRYEYAMDNPLSNIDPSGLQCDPWNGGWPASGFRGALHLEEMWEGASYDDSQLCRRD